MKKMLLVVILIAGVAVESQAKMTLADIKAKAQKARKSVQDYVKAHKDDLIKAGVAAATVTALALGGAIAQDQLQKKEAEEQARADASIKWAEEGGMRGGKTSEERAKEMQEVYRGIQKTREEEQ